MAQNGKITLYKHGSGNASEAKWGHSKVFRQQPHRHLVAKVKCATVHLEGNWSLG
jgi:hypothetical protein